MPKTLVARTLGTIDYQSGQRRTLEIDRDGVLVQLNLRLKYQIANGATGPSGPQFMTLARPIRRLEVLVGGRDTVVSQTGESLVARALLEFGTAQLGMTDTVVLTNSATTTYEVSIPVPFWLPRGRRPDDCALDLRDQRIKQVVLGITWGAAADLFTTPGTAAIQNVTLEVEGEYLLDVDPNQAFLARILDEQERELTGTNDAFDFILDRGSRLAYRSFMLIATANGVGDNGIINSAKLSAGSFVFFNRSAVAARAAMKRDYQQEALTTGLLMLTPLKFGELVDAINTGVLTSDLRLIFNATKVTGTNVIKVAREAVRPLDIG